MIKRELNILSLLLIFFCYVLQPCSAQGNMLQAKRVYDAILIDGNTNDWPQPFSLFDNKTRLIYAIANDEENLYLCLKCPDEWNQVKIMEAGMIVTISDKGKPKLNAAIHFPMGKRKDKQPVKAINPVQQPQIGLLRNNFILQNKQMNMEGFVSVNGVLPIDSGSIRVSVRSDSLNTLIYEAKIPLKELMIDNYSRELLLQVVIHGIEQSQTFGENGPDASMGSELGDNMNKGIDQKNRPIDDGNEYQITDHAIINIAEKSILKQKFILQLP